LPTLVGGIFFGYDLIIMLLSRDAILRHMKGGTVIIDPFDERYLNTTSYDVTLGGWFWRESHPSGKATVHNIYDESSTKKVWEGPFEAEPAEKVEERLGIKLKNLHKVDRIIIIGPKETILGHTREFIGGKDKVVGKMYARSSMGRNFVEVCKDAGWGDVGYFNRWTMEITNNSQHYSIPLVVGRRIAQIVFYEVEPLVSDYVEEGGKYQTSHSLDELKERWTPEMMVPRMHLDWDVQGAEE